MKKIWLVEFPTSKYDQDVKALARKNDLVIYDARFAGELDKSAVESKPPKLTIKGAKKANTEKVEKAEDKAE